MYRTRRIVASIRRSGWQGKRLQARPARTLDQQVALLGASMQSEALSIAPPIDVASPIAATEITMPITARIKAYSAADAPDSSFHRFFKKTFMTSYRLLGGPHPGMRSAERRVGQECVRSCRYRWS